MKQRIVVKIWVALLGTLLILPVAEAQDYNRYGYRGQMPGNSYGSPYKPPAPMRRYQPIQQATPDQLLRQGVEQTFAYLRRVGSTDLSNVLDYV
ncbi:MAG: hypothetical protein HN344_02320, partial [Gammaproteobacteria bacterium]|nr:hypothetical protein [Gammaproteobacteria bacterium]